MALLLALAAPVGATTYVPMADEDLADQAPLIALVHVAAVTLPPAGRPVTDYDLVVERLLKGSAPGRLVARVAGGARPDGSGFVVAGAPRFRVGSRALLFLEAHADGTFRILHLMLGAFHEVVDAGQRLALRDLHEATRLGPGRAQEPRRNLERFAWWLADRARGVRREKDYFVALAEPEATPAPFTQLDNARRFEFDFGGSVTWVAYFTGQPGMSGGGFAQFQAALQAWNNDPDTPILHVYGGTTTTNGGGFGGNDGINTILFDDPNNELGGTFNCATGGLLAFGSFDYFGSGLFNGVYFNRITEGDIVTQNGASCYYANLANGEEAFAHELGHTLGLGHSCGDAASGPCDNNPPGDDAALMRATSHSDGRGAALGSDDRAGIRFLYQRLGPPNDDFVNRIVLAGNPAGVSGTTWQASRETGEGGAGQPQCGGEPTPSPSLQPSTVWYSWTAPGEGQVTVIATPAVTNSPRINVFTGSALGSLTGVLLGSYVGTTNQAVFHGTAGTTYQIQLEGNPFNETAGGFTLTVSQGAPLTLGVNDVTVTEGNAGTVNATFSVALSAASAEVITVAYATANGTATAGSDYTAASGTLTFFCTVTARTITVPVLGDTAYELDETFSVNLSSPVRAVIADGQGLGTIVDDDPPPRLSIADARVREGDSGSAQALFELRLSFASPKPATVDYTMANGTAAAGSDYLPGAGTITFAPGVTSRTIAVPVTGDVTAEANETFFVDLSNPANAILPDGTLYAAQHNADNVSAYAIDPTTGALAAVPGSPFAAGDGAQGVAVAPTGRFAFVMADGSDDAFAYAVDLQTGALTAAPGSPFAAGIDPWTGAVDPLARFLYVPNFGGANVSGYAIDPGTGGLTSLGAPTAAGSAPGSAAIDPTGRFLYVGHQVSSNVYGYAIGAGGSLSAIPGSPFASVINVQWVAADPLGRFLYAVSHADGTAGNRVSGYAIDAGTGALTPVPGSPFASAAGPNSVAVDPSGRFVYVSARNADAVSAYTIGPSGALTAIPGSPFGTGVAPLSVAVSPSGRFLYVLTGFGSVVSRFAIDQGSGALSGLPAQSLGSVDARSIAIGPAPGAWATGTIENDDGPELSVAHLQVAEGNAGTVSAVLTATLASASAQTVTAVFMTADGTATAGSDYTAAFGPLTFLPGTTVQTIAVPVIGDTRDEPDEFVRVRLGSAAFADVARPESALRILDDDGAVSDDVVELVHGFDLLRTLAARTGAVAEKHWYVLEQKPYSSYELVIDSASGDVQPVVFRRLAADEVAVLQNGAFIGQGFSLSLRWANTTASPVSRERVVVQSGGCTGDCGAEDVYRIRAYETTASVPRFNNAGSQVTVLVLHNPAGDTISGSAYFWSQAGALLASQAFSLGPRALLALNTTTVPGVAGQNGSITVAHNGRYGVLAGKTVSVEPATGFSFDAILLPRPR